MHFPKPTFLSKWRVLEVIRLNHKIRGDVVEPGQRSKERRLSLIAPSSTLVLA
jgi:hypothetical protein